MAAPARIDKRITEAAAFTLKDIRDLKDRMTVGSYEWRMLDKMEQRMEFVTHQCERREVVFAKAFYMLEYNEIDGPGYLREQSKQLTMPLEAA